MSLKVYSGDLVVYETIINYYTDMEEIGNLLSNAANPVEFMCQVRMLQGNPSSLATYFCSELFSLESAGLEIARF